MKTRASILLPCGLRYFKRVLFTLIAFSLVVSASFALDVGTSVLAQSTSSATTQQGIWLTVKNGGRILEISAGYEVLMNGGGRVNFTHGGRVIEMPDGLTALVNDEPVSAERAVREGETVRIVDRDGRTLWRISRATREPEEIYVRAHGVSPAHGL